jgi:transcription elongation GreA/GreB family factor
MRIVSLAAASILALSAAPAFAQDMDSSGEQTGSMAQATAEFSDAEISAFAAALAKVTPLAQALNGAAPTAEQQAEMAAAIESSGLSIDRFNAISQAASSNDLVRARVELAQTPASATATSISDAEVEGFAKAMSELLPVAQALNGAAPSPEQQAQMEASITDAGLTRERFNEISGAVGSDAHLRARLAVADARAGR